MRTTRRLFTSRWLTAGATLVVALACASEELPSSTSPAGGAAGQPDIVSGSGGRPQGGMPGAGAGATAIAGEGDQQAQAGDGSESGAGAAGAPTLPSTDPKMLPTKGAVQQVHDPDVIKDGDTYYLFSTGTGISVRTSPDLVNWKSAPSAFPSKPSWITTTNPADPNLLWAPEVRYFGGQFHLYYAASKFGSKQSCIGHATRASLGSGAWLDQGQALFCSNLTGQNDDYNAIDPDPFVDQGGKIWLAFGSFWSGLKLIRLDAEGRRDGPDFFSLATRPNTAVEAPFLHYHDGFYYLFESVDSCCQGVSSTYKIMVGRSKSVTGPYLDRNGDALADGAGTLLLQGAGRWRGPGHNSILVESGQTYNMYHSYDAESAGAPTLRIAELSWSADGWPISAGP